MGCESIGLVCPVTKPVPAAPDTRSYVEVAQQIRERGVLGADYYHRTPGYPLLLALSLALTDEPTPALWIGPLLAGIAAAAIAWIAGLLTGRVGGALAAGLLFCVWLNAYQYVPVLTTDATHGFLAVTAVAATLWWRDAEKAPVAAFAAGLWMAVQSLRHTFFALPALLPFLLWKRRASRAYLGLSLAIWVSTCVVPSFVVGSNWVRHGRLLPAQACYAVPRLKQEMGVGEFRSLRARCIRRYRVDPVAQSRRDWQYLLDRPGPAAKSFAREIKIQMLYPVRPFNHRSLERLYPSWTETHPSVITALWLASAGGLPILARRMLPVALFLGLALALVMLPAANVHAVGARIRFPMDLFFLPVAVVFGDAVRGWIGALRRRLRNRDAREGPSAG